MQKQLTEDISGELIPDDGKYAHLFKFTSGCARCGKDRKLKLCHAPGLSYKGVELCRKCWQSLKLRIKKELSNDE